MNFGISFYVIHQAQIIVYYKLILLTSIVCSISVDRTLKGIDPILLEDGPLRPVDVLGNPVVPSIPAPWWFDGGLVAPPSFSVKSGVFVDSILVKLYCGTKGSTIVYVYGEGIHHSNLPDPTPYRGIVYDGKGIMVVKTGIIKAMAFHPFSIDSEVSYTDTIFIQSPAPGITLLQSPPSVVPYFTASINASGPTAPPRFGPFNGSITVLITADTAAGGRPYIRYTLNTTEPTPGDGGGGYLAAADLQGEARVSLRLQQTAIVRALAWEDGRLPSTVTSTGLIEVPISPALSSSTRLQNPTPISPIK
jgi:hypothetical protein